MITDTDKRIICKISKKYHAKRVLLFGSCLSPESENRDIDIGVEGVPHKDFYRYYGELMFSVSKPIDVIDISGTSKFIKLIIQEGTLLYG
ncbi:MAG: nucleotidyltransferase family protein [Thermodesulfobacteriota bacterium]